MRLHDGGAFFRVFVSVSEVHEFADRWPCFGTRRRMSFEFDKRNGDLVDITGDRGIDPGGVEALMQDAKTWGLARLLIQQQRRERAALADNTDRI